MSDRVHEWTLAPETRQDLFVLTAITAGLMALVARRWLLVSDDAQPAVVAIPIVLGVLAWTVPVRIADPQWIPRSLALLIGVSALAATLVLHPALPLPHTWTAIVVSIGAAIGEELFFRRLLYGWLLRWGTVAAIAGSAILFAGIHVPLYGPGVFWVDLGAGLMLSWQRWATGGWGTSACTHVLANLVAVFA